MPDKHELHNLIERLPESELVAAMRYLEFLLDREGPVDPEMLARIDLAHANPSPGISHQRTRARDVLREFGL